ncbi:hypothetical protein OF83DRAFT_229922 [Amylostereum chailletii]|nr:hypothetical protein OF83DRAFT_229922 [Amylostereum chailletii]
MYGTMSAGTFFSPATSSQGLWVGGQPPLQTIQHQPLPSSSDSSQHAAALLGASEDSLEADEILVSALRKGGSSGLNRLQAIESLVGVLNRSRSAWVDYYLAHRQRVDSLISVPVKPPPRADIPTTIPPTRTAHTQPAVQPKRPASGTSKRTTKHYANRLPDVPISEPSAPRTSAEQRKGSNPFTREDKRYAADMLLWELKQQPDLSLEVLAFKIADKAPHHTRLSWRWLLYKDPVTVLVWKRRPEHVEQPSTDEDYPMGRAGEPYGSGDIRAMARLIVQCPELESASCETKGHRMANAYPQRTWKGWAESFRTRNASASSTLSTNAAFSTMFQQRS